MFSFLLTVECVPVTLPLPQAEDRHETLRAQIRDHGPWWHQIDLGNGMQTRTISPENPRMAMDYPAGLWGYVENSIPQDLTGMKVLDIGCADGFFSVQCAKRHAKKIVSIDVSRHRIKNCAFVAKQLGMIAIEPRVQSIYDLNPAEKFDIVLMLGLLYHLDHPFLGLQKVSAITNTLLLETTFLEGQTGSLMEWRRRSISPREDGWNPSIACIQDMLHEAGFLHLQEIPRPQGSRIAYLCRK